MRENACAGKERLGMRLRGTSELRSAVLEHRLGGSQQIKLFGMHVYQMEILAMSKQTAIRLSDDTYERLQSLASKTGRTATFYMKAAIEEYIDDLEDLYLAEQALGRLNRGESRIVNLEEFWRGLDD
jgi:RHH-type transcriptional regulator, rel operon repressor / antitoxin RelB